MSDPFAEEPIPWWRRFVRNNRRTYAPRSVTFAIGFVAGFAGLTLPTHHSLATGVLAAAVTVAPAGLVEMWYRRRDRREDEQLIVLPRSATDRDKDRRPLTAIWPCQRELATSHAHSVSGRGLAGRAPTVAVNAAALRRIPSSESVVNDSIALSVTGL